jgi:hypothetical protein
VSISHQIAARGDDSLFDLSECGPVVRAERDRSREGGVGRSENTYVKHALIHAAVKGQLASFRIKNPTKRILLIDGNAGDGAGVPLPQLDIFGASLSAATPALLTDLAGKYDAEVLLCEKDKATREKLAANFPNTRIISDHAGAPDCVGGYDYAIWISDPNGPSGQGVDHMRCLSDRMKSDFVIAFNERFVASIRNKIPNSDDPAIIRAFEANNARYGQMTDPRWWASQLNRRRLAWTSAVHSISNRFGCRVLTVANFLSDGAARKPFEVVI